MKQLPIEFTLENDTHVVVNKSGTHTYDFRLTPANGSPRHFTYDAEKTKTETDESLDFDELNAVRTFWLKYEEET